MDVPVLHLYYLCIFQLFQALNTELQQRSTVDVSPLGEIHQPAQRCKSTPWQWKIPIFWLSLPNVDESKPRIPCLGGWTSIDSIDPSYCWCWPECQKVPCAFQWIRHGFVHQRFLCCNMYFPPWIIDNYGRSRYSGDPRKMISIDGFVWIRHDFKNDMVYIYIYICVCIIYIIYIYVIIYIYHIISYHITSYHIISDQIISYIISYIIYILYIYIYIIYHIYIYIYWLFDYIYIYIYIGISEIYWREGSEDSTIVQPVWYSFRPRHDHGTVAGPQWSHRQPTIISPRNSWLLRG